MYARARYGWVMAIGIVLAFLQGPAAQALVSPAGVSLTPPLQFPMRSASIVGARLNLFLGAHEAVMGLDLGAVGNVTDRAFGGVQLAGVFNRNQGPASIFFLQLAGIANMNMGGGSVYGVQLAGGANVIHGRADVVGLQIAPSGNFAPQATVGGAQIGLINRARDVYGLQLGLVNIAEGLHGLQLGLVNVNKTGPLRVLPVANFGF